MSTSNTVVGQAKKNSTSGAFFEKEFPALFDYELAFTKRYQEVETLPPAAREAAMLAFQFPRILQPLQSGDLLAGRIAYPKVAVGPQAVGVGYACPIRELRRNIKRGDYDEVAKEKAERLIAYWEPNRTQTKVRQAYPDWVSALLPSDEWAWENGESFPLYRIAGIQFCYKPLLRLGIEGFRANIAERMGDPQTDLVQGFQAALDVLQNCLRTYERDASEKSNDPAFAKEDREKFAQLACDLKELQQRPPATFRQACQLIWLYSLLSGIWNYGRLDDELGEFLVADLETSRISEEEAVQILQSWFKLMAAYDNRFDNRVMVGGRGRASEAAADRFALLAMEAVRRNRLNQPQLSLRFYTGQNPALYEKGLELLGEGCTFPILYNDDKAVPDVMKTHGVDERTAEDWLPYGCGETMLRNSSVSTPNAIINLPEILNRLLAREAAAPGTFPDFESLFSAYAARVRDLMRAGACSQKIQYDIVGRTTPLLMISMLYDDCVARKKSLLDGGARYLCGTNETYGNITLSDSLEAIRQLVYQKNKYTLAQIAQALAANFSGVKGLQDDLLAVPKFGNDNDEADAMAVRVHEQVCRAASDCAAEFGLYRYHVVLINNWANTLLGRFTGPTADGREKGQSFSNANNPTAGADRSGTTAFLNSLLKLDTSIHAGSVQNMKFSKSMFTRELGRLKALLEGYWKKGGVQAMLTVVSRADLEAAMREPEKWGHLMVRVGGFSMRFIDLDRDVQLDILRRTLNE